ncbi:MAG TPA: PP2C family protein-serine/threonine phosphatase [Gemmatales bacterium]|nr:PP2C family protein-serine/threonine phosphatase [Gemmatales bacterium]
MLETKATNSLRCMEIWGGNRAVEQDFELPGLDVWLYSRPVAEAMDGGDVYYLSSCASGRISRLLIADVSGHGPEVSQLALRLRDLMRRNINRIDQASFVEGMNKEFVQFNQEGRFATAIIGTYFASTGYLQLCTAGHPPPLLYRQATNSWERMELNTHPSSTGNIPLGIMDEVIYGQIELPLKKGDMVLAYTDGVSEIRIENNKLLGSDGLLEMVKTLDVNQASRLIPKLMQKLEAESQAPFQDDITLLLFRANSRQVPLVSNLLAPFRLLSSPKETTYFRETAKPN